MSSIKEKFSFLVVERLKEAFKSNTDDALAQSLGLKAHNIRDWKKNDTVNYRLLIEKTKGINLHWLFTGEGSMHLDPAKEQQYSRHEKELINRYRVASDRDKETVEFALRSGGVAMDIAAERTPVHGSQKKGRKSAA
jgi:hypothetical protein